jgi:hypothetical protein
MRGTIETFVHPNRLVHKRANDSGGECSNYAVGLAEKFNSKHRNTSPCVACPEPTKDVPCPAGDCRDEMPGCKVVLDKKGVNSAYTNYIIDGGTLGCAGSSELGLMLNQPETERVLAAPRSTGVNEENWTSPSQKLVGKPNPKFLIPPVVVPPCLDIDYWKTNNLVVRSGINDESTFDDFSSGYMVRPLPVPLPPNDGMIAAQSYQLPNTKPCDTDPTPIHEPKQGFQYGVDVKNTPRPSPLPSDDSPTNVNDDTSMGEQINVFENDIIEGFDLQNIATCKVNPDAEAGAAADAANQNVPNNPNVNSVQLRLCAQGGKDPPKTQQELNSLQGQLDCEAPKVKQRAGILPQNKQACLYTASSNNPQPGSDLRPLEMQYAENPQSLIGRERARILHCTSCDKLVDDKCMIISDGYHIDNLKVGLPTNFGASEGGKSPATAQLNSDTFTQTILPGVYQNSQIIEPINSMIGISLTTQIPPTTLSEQDGDLLYQLHDPNLYTPPVPEEPDQSPNTSNVTDPRSFGYGSSNRAYHEPMTGQTRFYYDDVNIIRMPNYIARSKIDTNPWADKYEPCPEGYALGNPNTRNIRELANNAFRDATIEHRTGMMQSLMRKRNAEMYQLRMMPKSMGGGSFATAGGGALGGMFGGYPAAGDSSWAPPAP